MRYFSDKIKSTNKMVVSMICPKCGTENEEGILFCENCDWRMDIPYVAKKEGGEKAKIFAPITFVLGIISAVLLYFFPVGSIVFGGAGLLLGGYAFNISRAYEAKEKNIFIALSAIGLLLSMISFIMGFGGLL